MHLLAGECDRIPVLAELAWDIRGTRAVADLHRLESTRIEGTTLVIDAAPDALPLINELHAAGWLRDGESGGWLWELTATLTRGPCTLQVTGSTITPPEHSNPGVPWYFAPAPPQLPARTSARFRREYQEWERKCRALAW